MTGIQLDQEFDSFAIAKHVPATQKRALEAMIF
jgi:hypothetical protein